MVEGMSTRILDPSEYGKLVGLDVALVGDFLPEGSKVVVVEREGVVLGTWSLIPYYHLECMQVIGESKGRGKVARKLLSYMFQLMNTMGLKAVITSSITEEVEIMIKKLGGTELPGKHFVMPVVKKGY